MTTISQERSALSKVAGAPKLRRREQWGSTFNYGSGRYTVAEPATRTFIHISVTNPSAYKGNDAHAQALERIGRSRFPNTGVSYNRGCMPNAALYELQPIGRQGAHTVNDFRRSTCSTSGCPGRGKSLTAPSWNNNVNSRAYVICQNVNDVVTDAMVDALARAIVADYRAGFITLAAAHNPHGHRCVSAKSCPGNKMWAKMPALHTRIHHYLDNGLPSSGTGNGSSGGSMWTQTLKATKTATKRIKDSYSLRAEHVLTHILGIVYQHMYGKVALNAATLKRFPNLPKDGYNVRVLARAGYGRILMIEEDVAKGFAKLQQEQAKSAARQASIENLLQQLLDRPGQPIDMAQVAEAARLGAQESLSALEVRIEINPAQEPDGSEDLDDNEEPDND